MPFLVLFLTIAIIGTVHGSEPKSIDGVVNQGSLTIPFLVVNNNEENPSYLATGLATGAAAVFGTVLYLMNTHSHDHAHGGDTTREGTGMNGGFGTGSEILDGQAGSIDAYRYRYKRSVENFDESSDGFFGMIKNMDTLGCGETLVCQLEAKATEELEQDEALILTLFSDQLTKPVNLSSDKAQYDLAAKLGLVSRNKNICQQRYMSCPYTSDEMMTTFRNNHI